MSKNIIALAEDIACHAGWYAHYANDKSLSIGMRKWSHGSLPRGMKWIHWIIPSMDIYIIDGSTTRRKRIVLLARINWQRWILIVELDKWFTEQYWVYGKYNTSYDYVRYDLEITEKEALKILGTYWRCALINKDIYPHLEVIDKALRKYEDV
ncbi:MAG: hypothetical protein J7K21_01000 [Desulfurococcales archaeon]|nr:hypothetical protein [Desulfurococcales archaeon]